MDLRKDLKKPVWLTNHHCDKGGVTAKALLHQLQLLSTKAVHLKEKIFQYLRSPSVKIPENCRNFLGKHWSCPDTITLRYQLSLIFSQQFCRMLEG